MHLQASLSIELQLTGKRLAVVEPSLFANAADELDTQVLAVEIALETEEVYLDGATSVVVDGGTTSDVEHTFIYIVPQMDAHGIDSVGRDEFQWVIHLDIGRGEA